MNGPSDNTEAASVPASSVADKAAAFEEYLFDDEQDDTPLEGEEADLEEGDLEAEGEEADEQEGEPDEPAIAPPASLNAEEKATFLQLPPEAQQAWAASESRRNAQVQEATTKAAERERAATTAAQSAEAAAQSRYAAQLKAFIEPFRPVMPSPQLAQHDPASYIAAKAQYDADIAQFDAFEQQIAGIQNQAVTMAQQIDTQSRAADLMTVPKLADPASREAYVAESLALVETLGLDPRAFEATAGSEDFRALEKVGEWKAKAEKYDKAMSNKMARVRSGKSRSTRPGAAPHADARAAGDKSWQRVKGARNKSEQATAFADYLGL